MPLDNTDQSHSAVPLKPFRHHVLTLNEGLHAINVAAGRRMTGAWHIQNVNVFFDYGLKLWMLRCKGVAPRSLADYLGGFRALIGQLT